MNFRYVYSAINLYLFAKKQFEKIFQDICEETRFGVKEVVNFHQIRITKVRIKDTRLSP